MNKILVFFLLSVLLLFVCYYSSFSAFCSPLFVPFLAADFDAFLNQSIFLFLRFYI